MIKEGIYKLSFTVALVLELQLQLQLQLQYNEYAVDHEINTFLYKNLCLGHLNMIS